MTATTTPSVLSATAQGIAVHEAALGALEPLLKAARDWHDAADRELAAVLHADAETRQRAVALVRVATEAHTDHLRLALKTARRMASLRAVAPAAGTTIPGLHDAYSAELEQIEAASRQAAATAAREADTLMRWDGSPVLQVDLQLERARATRAGA